MNRALWKLLGMRARAAIRTRLRKLRTVRGFVYLMMLVLVLLFVLASGQLKAGAMPALEGLKDIAGASFDEGILTALLLGGCILTLALSTAPPVYFSPAELQFLFGGPFTRGDLLLYKIAAYTGGAAISSLLLGLLTQHPSRVLVFFLSALLTLLFVQLLTTGVSLLNCALTIRGVRFVQTVFLVALTVALLALLATRGEVPGAHLFSDPRLSRIATSPFGVFAHLFFVTELFPEFLFWTAAAAFINICLMTGIVCLGQDYREIVSAASEHLHERWKTANRSGVWADIHPASWRIPHILGRSVFGMLVWRQLTTAMRTFRGSLARFLVVAVVVGPAIAIPSSQVVPLPLKLGLITSLVLFLLPKAVTFDFRGDWEHMDYLRSLPLQPYVVSAAQLVTPVALTTAIEAISIASSLPFVPRSAVPILLLMMASLTPFNGMLFAIDNLMFLLFPSPLTPVGRLDFEFFGRALLEFTVRSCIICATCGLALGLGWLTANWIGDARVAFFFAAWSVLLLTILALLPCLAWAYRRFDAG